MNRLAWLLVVLAAGPAPFSAQPKRDAPLPESDLRKILAVLCPGHDYVGAKKSGCKVCPDGTFDAGLDAGFGGTVETTIAGHLSEPGSDDVLLVMRGCEPHANGFVDTMLFTKKDGEWSLESNRGGGAIGECRKIPDREGRDGLLCHNGDYHYGIVNSTLTFEYIGGSSAELLSTVAVSAPCDPSYGLSTVMRADIKDEQWVDNTLKLTAECVRYRKDCKRNPEPKRTPRVFHIDYVFDGESLKLAPASVAAKRAYDACSKMEEDPPAARRPAARKKP
jgi:hypothetical protein